MGKRITINITDDNYNHIQKLMKELDITESEAVEYVIEKNRVCYLDGKEIKLVADFTKSKN